MTTPTRSDLGRALAALRPNAAFRCEVCGQEFTARVASGQRVPMTCSPACRQKLYRNRKRDARSVG